MGPETELAMARRHVAEAEARIARQRQILGQLREAGHPTDTAEELLHQLLETCRLMREHRDHLERPQHG